MITSDLLEGNPIQVAFQGKQVHRLTVTHIAFWNNGEATIDKEDISHKTPLSLTAKDGCTILLAEIIASNKPANNFTLETRGGTKILSFDYVDYKDGVIIKVYHTGSNINDVDLTGTIRGARGLVNTDKTTDVAFNIINSVENSTVNISAKIIPNWLIKFMVRVEARQNVFLQVLMFLPFMVIAAPFAIIYMATICLIFFPTLLLIPFTMLRYSLPRELYVPFRYASD